jgi:uncharacterized protein (DUF952 family)
MERIAYKVMTATDVAEFETGIFNGAPIDLADGFIHLSTAAQLTQTVQRHFAGQSNLTVAAVDLAGLGDAVRWEPSRGDQLFPHLYGPLRPAAVIGRCVLSFAADGSVVMPVVDLTGAPGAA